MPRSATERMWESASPRWSLDDRDICCVMILPSADLLSAISEASKGTAHRVHRTVDGRAAGTHCRARRRVTHRTGATGCRPTIDRCCRIRYQHVCSYPSIVAASEGLIGLPITKSTTDDSSDLPPCGTSVLPQVYTAGAGVIGRHSSLESEVKWRGIRRIAVPDSSDRRFRPRPCVFGVRAEPLRRTSWKWLEHAESRMTRHTQHPKHPPAAAPPRPIHQTGGF